MNKRIKRYLSLLLAVVMLLAYVPSASAASREAQEAADALHDLGLFNGTGTDENGNPIYELDRAPTRAESVTMLVRLLGKENEATSGTWNTPFTDVADWAKPYVGYAYANGLTNGVGANTFGGGQTVTASQYLTFVLRALGYDSGTDFQWDKAWELSDKVGVTKGEYGASSAFTRGDVAIVSYRALSAKFKDGSRTLMNVVDSSIEHGTVYAVSSLDVSGKSVTATVNTINACTLKITFYDEDETKTVATASVRIPANREMEAFKTTASASLPKYFVAEAVLTDAGGKQLCDPYKTMKYTKKYEEFEATTVNDFDGDDIVMNFDEDIKTNFAVLNDGAVRVDCADTVNACSADGNVLTFANANAQLDGIQEGTILALYVDDVAMMSVLVKSVSRSGNVVSVMADDDYEMQEMYQYIKVDVSETADEYYRTDDSGTIAYSEQGGGGVAFASAIYAAPHGGGTALYASLFDPIKVKSEDTLEGEVSYDLTDAVTLSAKISAKVAYSLKVSYDVRLFGKDYYEIEYKAELSGKIGGSVKAKAGYDSTDNEIETFKLSPKDLTLELGKFYIPTPIPALSITAELQIPLKINVQGEVSWEGQFKITSGFTCHQDAKGKYSDKFEDKAVTTDTFKVSVEGSVSFGIRAAVGADFASVISAEAGAEAGIKVKIGAAKEFGSGLAFGKPEEKHYCAICLEGEAKLYFKADISFRLGFKIGKKIDIGIGNTWTIAEVEFLKRDFYYSVDLKLSGDPNYKGWGTKCPNRGYLVTVLAKDGDGEEIADLGVHIFGSDKNGATDDKLKTGGSVYLRPGTYTAYITGSDGKEYTKAFTVTTKAEEVVVEGTGVGATAQARWRITKVTMEGKVESVLEPDDIVAITANGIEYLREKPGLYGDIRYPGIVEIREYDENGKLISLLENPDRLNNYVFPNGNEPDRHDYYEYDTNGRLLRKTESIWYVETEEEPDSNGRWIVSEVEENQGYVDYTYDANDRIISEHHYGQSIEFDDDDYDYYITYQYDKMGNVVKEVRKESDGSDSSEVTYAYIYDASGRILTETSSNGFGWGIERLTYSYNAKGLQDGLLALGADGGTIYACEYFYDDNDNLVRVHFWYPDGFSDNDVYFTFEYQKFPSN